MINWLQDDVPYNVYWQWNAWSHQVRLKLRG